MDHLNVTLLGCTKARSPPSSGLGHRLVVILVAELQSARPARWIPPHRQRTTISTLRTPHRDLEGSKKPKKMEENHPIHPKKIKNLTRPLDPSTPPTYHHLNPTDSSQGPRRVQKAKKNEENHPIHPKKNQNSTRPLDPSTPPTYHHLNPTSSAPSFSPACVFCCWLWEFF